MRVAIATFGAEVSPRVCFAREFLLVDLDVEADPGTRLSLGDTGYPDRLRLLERMGVGLLVCGGFPRAQLPAAERAGLRVVCGVDGPVRAALEAVRAGRWTVPSRRGGCRGAGAGGVCRRLQTRHRGGVTSKEETTHVRKANRRGRV